MTDLCFDIASISEPLRPAADMLADRSREIAGLLEAGRATDEWAQMRLRSIGLLLDILRQPTVALLAHEAAAD